MAKKKKVPQRKVYLEVDRESNSAAIRYNYSRGVADDKICPSAKKLISLSREYTDFSIATVAHGSLIPLSACKISEDEIENDLKSYLRANSFRDPAVRPRGGVELNTYFIHEDSALSVLRNINERFRPLLAAEALSRASLGSVVAEFEFLLRRVAIAIAEKNPKSVIGSSFTIEGDVLFCKSSREEILEHCIEQRITSKLHESLSKSIEWVCSLVDNSLVESIKQSAHYKGVLEAYARRNILMHNGGLVNDQYINACNSNDIDVSHFDKGDKADVDPEYLQKASLSFLFVGLSVIHGAIGRMGDRESEFSFGELTTISHEMLNAKLYVICFDIVSLARRIGSKDERSMSILYINKILSIRDNPDRPLSDRQVDVKEMIDSGRWVKNDAVIDLAIACLKNEFNSIRQLAQSAIEAGLTIHDASSFYVFEEARKKYGLLKFFSEKRTDYRNFSKA